MRVNTIKMICVAAGVACMQLGAAQAQQGPFDDVNAQASYADSGHRNSYPAASVADSLAATGGCETCNNGAVSDCGAGCDTGCCDTGCCEDVCCDACCDPCAPSGSFIFMAEALFLKYHRADGARVGYGANETAEFDLEFSPRLTAGYMGANGLGIRGRWWLYDHSASVPETDGGALGVDTWNLDIELVQALNLGRCVTLEISGGLRYNDFTETMTDIQGANNGIFDDARSNQFDGFGLVLGAEVIANAYDGINVYGRIRYATLMDDKTVSNNSLINGGSELFPQNVVLRDVVVGQLELAAGIELARQTSMGNAFFRFGVEYQTWYDYSTEFALADVPTLGPIGFPGNFLEFLGGPSNVGFGGITVAAGLSR